MRLHILSDLHLEFETVNIPRTDADVVVLAGDLHLGLEGCRWARKQFPDQPVIYVLGNHEYYRHSWPGLMDLIRHETEGSNIHVLENNSVEINGVTFLGCTLWTDFQLSGDPAAAMFIAEGIMSDYILIRFDPEQRPLRARDTARLHTQSVAWLQREMAKHDPARTIAVTHAAPSARSEAPFHATSPLKPAFASNLDALVEQSRVPLWIHGHTHYNVDYRLGATRVLTNQRGYPEESHAGFNPALVIEV